MVIKSAIPATYRFGPFLLNASQRVLLRRDEIVPLSPKAICLLTFLVENAGQVVDKEAIFAAVWPGTFVVESSLTKNISLLRKVLGEADSVIQTVSKRGYRFVAPVSQEEDGTARRGFAPWLSGAVVAAALLTMVVLAAGRWSAGTGGSAVTESERQYLIARHIWSRMERSELKTALSRFERAAQLDPSSAAAYAGIAETRATMTIMATGLPEVNLAKAREAAMRALELNPNVALPHVSIGVVRMLADFDLAGAERAYRKALQLDPNLVSAQLRYACYLTHAGRLSESRSLIQRALQRDPVSPLLAFQAATIEYFDRSYRKAIAGLHELVDREPSFSLAHYYLAMALGQLGRAEEALHELRQSRLNASLLETDEAWLHSIEGDREPAHALLESRRRLVRDGRAKATILLLPAIDSGDSETAMQSLHQMWKTHEIELLMLKVDPRFDPLRRDPRFQDLVQRIWPAV